MLKNLPATPHSLPWPRILLLALRSARRFLRLAVSGDLKRSRQRLHCVYDLGDDTARKPFSVFRETDYLGDTTAFNTVLVVGFRLRLLGANPILHWMFQRVCLLTTPFWSGFPGFGVKLWMVNPTTKDYAGVYQWQDERGARHYVEALTKVLRPLSTTGSVWYDVLPGQSFDAFLTSREMVIHPGVPSNMVDGSLVAEPADMATKR